MIDSFDNVTVIADASIYPNGPDIDQNAQLIKSRTFDPVYLTQYGVKRWVTNPQTFTSLGFGWDKILTVEPYVLQLFQTGPNIT